MKPARTETSAPCTITRDEFANYLPIVHRVVARMMRRLPRHVQRDDLVAAGSIGLVEALRKTSDRDAAFDWYVTIRIRGAVIDELRSQDWLPRSERAQQSKARDRGEGPSLTLVSLQALSPETDPLADSETPSALQLLEVRRFRAAIAKAATALPEREAQIVMLHYFEGVPFKDIAESFGLTQGRISQLHSQALGKLREDLGVVEEAA